MAKKTHPRTQARPALVAGFTMLEMLTSVAIVTMLMSAVFSFMYQAQKRFQGNQVDAEANQSVRAAMELLTQEIGQAGYNPDFYPNKTLTAAVTGTALPACVSLSPDTSEINLGDWIMVDTGAANEIVQVSTTGAGCAPNQIPVRFLNNHPAGAPVVSYKMPYADGILRFPGSSTDSILEFFGDINGDGTINNVVYSLAATTTPATVICIPAVAPGTPCAAGNTYTLYTLRRSITPVTFAAGAVNNPSSPLVQNVLYNTASAQGPTGQSIFQYPNTVTMGVVPDEVTVVGTVVVTLSVAVNPQSLETSTVTWHTMATQIRPLNLIALLAANQAGASKYISRTPAGLPMAYPANY